MVGLRPVVVFSLGLLGAVPALAQKTTNITFDLFMLFGVYTSNPQMIYDADDWTVLCSAGPLGYATFVTTGVAPVGGAPLQVTAGLNFNAVDTISFSFTSNDPNWWRNLPNLPGGTITGGTGKYAGATGTFDFMLGLQESHASGTLTLGSQTMPLNLTVGAFQGCNSCARIFTNGTVSGSTSLGNVSGTLDIEYTFHNNVSSSIVPQGVMTLTFNSTDSINVLMSDRDSPVTFPIVGGTGAYAGASGSLNVSKIHSGNNGYEYTGSGTVTTPGPGAPIITQVKMAFGSSTVIAKNGWLEIHGTNLAPADTPSTGVDWSNAPEFASGRMPTSLGAIDSVTVNGVPAYIYFYCSAATDPSCAGGDQINVLSPLSAPQDVVQVVVTRNGVASPPYAIEQMNSSPAMPWFDTQGHVVARHLDGSLVGPAALYPGASTPAKAGETVILVAFGAGLPANAAEGSASQSGPLTATPTCWISGQKANVSAAFVSPGLAQLNVTIPGGAQSGDDPIMCWFGDKPVSPGAVIAVK
jgi:uncharacterized protein (TIGR03437 family)